MASLLPIFGQRARFRVGCLSGRTRNVGRTFHPQLLIARGENRRIFKAAPHQGAVSTQWEGPASRGAFFYCSVICEIEKTPPVRTGLCRWVAGGRLIPGRIVHPIKVDDDASSLERARIP